MQIPDGVVSVSYTKRFDSISFEVTLPKGKKATFIYDDENKILRGEKTNKVYKIGQKIKVEVIGASKQTRTVDFMLKHETD